MIDVVHRPLLLLQIDQVVDDGNDVGFRQRCRRDRNGQSEFAVESVSAHIAQVVPFFIEEEAIDERLCGFQIGRIARPKLLVDCGERIFFRTNLILRDGLCDDGFFTACLSQKAKLLDICLLDPLDQFFRQNGIFIDEDFACLPVHDIATYHATIVLLEIHLCDIDLLHEIEQLKNLVIGRIPESAQQRGDRELLLPVDVCIHHIVNVGRKLHPRSTEGDDTGRVNGRAVGVDGLTEEDAWRAMELTHDNALGAIDDKRTPMGHCRQVAEIHILLNGVDVVFPVLRLLGESEFCLHWDGVGETPFLALGHRILGFFDVVFDELQKKIFAGVGDGKIHLEHRMETFVFPACRCNIGLKETVPRLQLDAQQIWRFDNLGNFPERDSLG